MIKRTLTNLDKYFFRILLYELLFIIFFQTIISNIDINSFNKKEILSLLISVTAVIIAIIVTFLFSKLFAEKTIRIERKKDIDELSLKITYLRRIAYHIRSLHEFWQKGNKNIKSIIDSKYPNLKYEEYRGYEIPGMQQFTYDEFKIMNKEISETIGQGYLALKGLENGENEFSFYTEVNPQNYSLDDVARYKEYTQMFWSMLDRTSDDFFKITDIHPYWLKNIEELYFKITGKQINKNEFKNEIKALLTFFDSIVFEKHYYLNSLNSNMFPSVFKDAFINMLFFLLILIISLILFIINFDSNKNIFCTIFLVSLFISNTADLILLTFLAIKNELNVREIFKI